MITLRKLKIFKRFKGDIDMWVRAGGSDVGPEISGAEWSRIDELIQSLVVIDRGLAAESFAERTRLALERDVEEDAREELRRFAAKEARRTNSRWWSIFR